MQVDSLALDVMDHLANLLVLGGSATKVI